MICELTVCVVRTLTCELCCPCCQHWPVNWLSMLSECHVRMLTCELLLSVLSEHWPANFYCPCCQNIDLWTSAVIICWPVNFYCLCCQNSDLWMFTVHVVRTLTCECLLSMLSERRPWPQPGADAVSVSTLHQLLWCCVVGWEDVTQQHPHLQLPHQVLPHGMKALLLLHSLTTSTHTYLPLTRMHPPTIAHSHRHLLIIWIRRPFVLRI